MENFLYPTDVALSPRVILERTQQITEKYGLESFITQRTFKRAREMYQTAIYAIGMTARTGDYYWVAPSRDNTPDCYLIWKKDTGIFIECVEITLWNERVETMWEIIKKKITKKYPSHFSIVIHDSRAADNIQARDYQILHEKLRQHLITPGTIRFWTEIKNKGQRNVLLGELYPENDWTEFCASHVLKNYRILPERVRLDVLSSGSKMVFRDGDLNNVTLPPLPDLIEI
jgi:hypothetical protein